MQQTPPSPFFQSCANHAQYPQNLISEITKAYPWELDGYDSKFAAVRSRLCLEKEEGVDVPTREFYPNSGHVHALQEHDIKASAQLNTFFQNVFAKQNPTAIEQQHNHPRCRFIYIYAGDSRARLRVTYEMLTQILTYHQVMPGYLDFLHAFGAQGNPRGQYFAGFCHQTMLEDTVQAPKMVARSWRQYQMCYNLRGVAPTIGRYGKISEWSVRQAAIHHQFDVVHGTATWIVTKGRKDLLQRFDQMTSRLPTLSFETSQDCFRTSLDVHRMFCQWSAEDWRQYVDWLEDGLESNTSMALYGSQESKNSRPKYEPRNLQEIQIWKELTSRATMLMESNANVMAALRAYYLKLPENEDFPLRTECQKSLQNFATDIESNIVWIKMQVRRLNLLGEIISDRKDLVAQHFQNQMAERTEQLNHNLEKEAVVMRIITIVTLVYLPATFVSTFFSTDIVKYQNQDSTESGANTTSYSHLAMMRWLQVTLPLTFVTILGAWMAFKTATISQKGSEMKDSLVDRNEKVMTKWNLRRKMRVLEKGEL